MTLAKRLKGLRKEQGLSQTELARKVDVSQPTIANWERGGHTPRPVALARIADALGTDATWLLSGELPAGRNPAHQHLAKPIHHIPVFDWPNGQDDPLASQPKRYITVAMDADGLFALFATTESGHPDGSVLIFSRTERALPGKFLCTGPTGYTVADRTSLRDDIFARLVYSVVPH